MQITGTNASEQLIGTSGNDTILGLAGNDTIDGSTGNDYIDGGDGDDLVQMSGGAAASTLVGGNGNDQLFGDAGNDILNGDAGDDYLDGGPGNDNLVGGAGADRLFGNSGADSFSGGDGDDILYLGDLAGNTTMSGGAGNDQLFATGGNDLLNGDDGNDYIDAGTGDDMLFGGAGNDDLYAGGGNDTLSGGSGVNYLSGSSGNDFYIINTRTDEINDISGIDSGLINVDFYKSNTEVENWFYTDGVQKLPYWIDALLPNQAPGFAPLLNGTKTFFYAFPTTPPAHFDAADRNGFRVFTPEQQAATRQALAYVASVLDLRFVETSDAAGLNTMVFADNVQPDSAGYALFPFNAASGSDVFIDYSGNNSGALNPIAGTYTVLTLIHEIGHALGLKHSFGTNAAVDGPFLSAAEDTTQWTVMSYNSRQADYYLHFAPLDIAALQYMYGVSTAAAGGNVVQLRTDVTNMVWDGGGDDTLDGSALTQNATIYLEPGYWGFIGNKASIISAAGQVTVNFGTSIENVLGGSGNDLLVGTAVANRISGGAGNDTVSGGAGNDSFFSLSGRDIVNGGNDFDVLALTQNAAQLQVVKLRANAAVVKDGAGNFAYLRDVEQINYADKAVAMSATPSYFNVDAAVTQIYVAGFRRAPETSGYNYWLQEKATKGVVAMAETIFSLDIVKAIYPTSMTATDFVTAIYQNVFNKAPDAGGLNYWSGELAAKSRGQLVLDMTTAALGVQDGVLGKDFFQDRLDWSLYAVGYQKENGFEITPQRLASLTDTVNADPMTALNLIGQGMSGVML